VADDGPAGRLVCDRARRCLDRDRPDCRRMAELEIRGTAAAHLHRDRPEFDHHSVIPGESSQGSLPHAAGDCGFADPGVLHVLCFERHGGRRGLLRELVRLELSPGHVAGGRGDGRLHLVRRVSRSVVYRHDAGPADDGGAAAGADSRAHPCGRSCGHGGHGHPGESARVLTVRRDIGCRRGVRLGVGVGLFRAAAHHRAFHGAAFGCGRDSRAPHRHRLDDRVAGGRCLHRADRAGLLHSAS